MQDFWNKVLPGSVKTDHGKFNSADLLIIILNILLFGYTAYRSFRFLQSTFAGNDTTGEFTVAAIIALVGLDVAAVAWSLVWMFGSTTKWQDLVALVMFIVSLVGMVLTSMTDTLAGESNVPPALKFSAYYGVPAIILLNVAAGIMYHMISPQVSLGRKERRMKADTRETQMLGELAQQDTAMKLEIAEKQARQNDELIARQQRLAEQKIKLDAIKLGIKRAMSDDETLKTRGAAVEQEIKANVAPPPITPPQLAYNADAPILPVQDNSDFDSWYMSQNAQRQKLAPLYQRANDLRARAGADGFILESVIDDTIADEETRMRDLITRLEAEYKKLYSRSQAPKS